MRLVTTDGSLTATRVLLAHPRDDARRGMRATLEPLGCVVDEAGGVDDALAAVRAAPHDVVLLHRELGDALSAIKGDPDLFRVAVILVGEPPDVASVLAALERGAHDVLREDAPAPELIARVRAARRAQEMHEQLLTREHDLEELAYHDELTGLPNRRFALRQLHALLSRARRHELDLSVLLIDADRFKSFNDRHGHPAGDAVLRGLAERLCERVREEDIVARYGGEEFLVILPDTTPEGAAALAEDLRDAVAAEPFSIGRFALPVTVSVGWGAWNGEDLEQLVARADRGLYAAKEAGRNCVRQDPMGAEAGSR
ncbi:MAG: two-component system, cell cycle response regulator [Solirubrobacteraceae bacterium]|jgi:two-component system cell cycle response regulator|nr:two-component system, cell cycle response regulator [Solirubrobacteraceae bacterium]